MKKIIFPLLLFIIIFTCKNVYAEDFTQANRFEYWTYINSDTQVRTGTGMIPYSTNTLNRIQWLYSNYTYDPNYLYDITFKVKNKTFSGNDYNLIDFIDSCQISTGSGVYYSCYVNENHTETLDTISISIFNMVGDNRSTLWLNFYSSSNKPLYLETTGYTLTINRKQDKGATSDDIFNAADSINNNNNQNTQDIIDNQNENTQDIIDNQNENTQDLIDNITDSNTTQAQNSGSSWFSNFRIDSSRGFSSIVTAPVRLIQGILTASTGSCTPLSYTINMKATESSTTQSKEVSLPCGSALWNRVPSAVVLLYYTTIFGLFGWYVLRDMVLFVDKSQDPTDKSAFIMKL